jgi:hypothetical protein
MVIKSRKGKGNEVRKRERIIRVWRKRMRKKWELSKEDEVNEGRWRDWREKEWRNGKENEFRKREVREWKKEEW